SHLALVLFLVVGLLYLSIAKVNEKASGPVLVRASNKISVTASISGLVRLVQVSPGNHVSQGDLLVSFEDSPGDTLLDRFRKQLRAPTAGMVSDVRVRYGQQVSAGDELVSIIDDRSGNETIALLPGSYAPQIHQGMLMTLKLQGYPDSRELVPIDSVGREVIGPH